jgi:hypothetical protein
MSEDSPNKKSTALTGPEKLANVLSLLLTTDKLYQTERLSLRETCRACREVHDQAATSIALGCPSVDGVELSPADIKRTVEGALARGCKPKKAVLSLGKHAAANSSASLEVLT